MAWCVPPGLELKGQYVEPSAPSNSPSSCHRALPTRSAAADKAMELKPLDQGRGTTRATFRPGAMQEFTRVEEHRSSPDSAYPLPEYARESAPKRLPSAPRPVATAVCRRCRHCGRVLSHDAGQLLVGSRWVGYHLNPRPRGHLQRRLQPGQDAAAGRGWRLVFDRPLNLQRASANETQPSRYSS